MLTFNSFRENFLFRRQLCKKTRCLQENTTPLAKILHDASVATNPTSVLCIIILSSFIIFLSQPLHPLSSWSVILLAKLCWLLPHLDLWFSSLRRSHPLVRHTRILRLLLISHRSHLSAKQVVHWTLDIIFQRKCTSTWNWLLVNASEVQRL